VLGILAGGLWLVFILLIAEAMRRQRVEPEWVRKFVHIGTGNIIFLAWGIDFPLGLCLAFCIPFIGLTLVSYRLPILQSINGVGRRSLGTFYYALSITLLIGCFWPMGRPEFAALGILIMTWGDALAAIVGKQWGTHGYTVMGVHKTLEGSVVMGVVSTAVSLVVLSLGLGFSWSLVPVALVLGLLAAGLEVFSIGGIDNLTVPLGTALVAWFWLG